MINRSATAPSEKPSRSHADAGRRHDRTPESAAALFDEYGTLALSLAHRIVQDRALAEDVVQEAFLDVWRHADRFDPSRGSMRTWLCRIVRNRALDRVRGSALRQREDQPLDALRELTSTADVLADVLRADEARAVAAALAALPAGQREAIELAYYGGYTQPEIAARTALPLGTVKSRTRLAMRALAASLAWLNQAPTGVAPDQAERTRLGTRRAPLAAGAQR